MATIGKALELAARAHEGQLDKEGLPYILHPIRVMQHVHDPEAQIVAILHDVVEDTAITLDDLRRAGFSEVVVEAVRCVTHDHSEPYADYVVRCRHHPLARLVKLADLRDNSRLERAILRADHLDRDLARMRRYILSYKFLTDQIDEATYRRLMTESGNTLPA